MQKYIHKIEEFSELFEKIKFETEKYWATYTAIMFKLKDNSRLNEFQEFLLKYIRISDTVFSYSKSKVLLILEETTLRWWLIFNEKLREKINEKWFKYDYYCAAIQWDFIDSDEKLIKSLKKRLKKAHETKSNECVYSLSNED